MSVSIPALISEINNDPSSLGYAAQNDKGKANLLNALTGPGAASVFRNDIKPIEVINSLVASEFSSMTTVPIQKLTLMLQSGNIDATLSNVRTIFLGIFSGMSGTVTAITALAQRTGSRAEVLFGTGTIITEQNIGQARNGL